nr:hypothetical protein [Geobacteraceae bacterium]
RTSLKERVEKWWKENGLWIPPFLSQNHNGMPYGVLVRQIATFRYEDSTFLLLAESGNLQPMWLEYTIDRFSVSSPYKRSLLKRTTCEGLGRNGGYRLRVERLGNIDSASGAILSTIETDRGEQLVDYHHRIFDRFVGKTQREDLSSWLHAAGSCAQDFYDAYFSLFVAHCILFENYEEEENGKKSPVLYGIAKSAFNSNRERFGAEPLIVAMPTWQGKYAFYPQQLDWRNDGVLTRDDLLVSREMDYHKPSTHSPHPAMLHGTI